MLSFNNCTSPWTENCIVYKILWHFKTVKGLIVCWYLTVQKVKSMIENVDSMLPLWVWRKLCLTELFKMVTANCVTKQAYGSCINGIQFNSKTWQEKPGILTCFVLGKNQTLLELFLHGHCRYLKYQFSHCNSSKECSIQSFFIPWTCCAFKTVLL